MDPERDCFDDDREQLLKKDACSEIPDRIPLYMKIAYGVGTIPDSMTATIQGFFITPFLLEVAKIPPSSVALLLLIQRIIDACVDPIVGTLTDRTRTKIGKRRPWMLGAVVPCAAAYMLTWVSFDWSEEGRTIYFGAMFFLYQLTFSAYFVPYTALTMAMSSDTKERDSLTSFRTSFQVFSQIVGVVIQGQLIAAFGADRESEGYVICALVVSGIVLICGSVAGLLTKERVVEEEPAQGRANMLQSLKLALGHKAYIILALLYLSTWCGVIIIQNNLILYLKYSLGLYSIFQNVLLVLLGSALASIFVWSKVVGKFGKKRTYIVGQCLLMGVTSFLYWGTSSGPLFFVVAFLAGVGIGVAFLMPPLMLPDVIDHARVIDGDAPEGLYYSFFVFSQKLATGIAIGVSTWALEKAGYDADIDDAASQPAAVSMTLRILSSWVPIGFNVLSILLLVLYPISDEMNIENQKILARRRKSTKLETPE